MGFILQSKIASHLVLEWCYSV